MEDLSTALDIFPDFDYVFAYGSGVHEQLDQTTGIHGSIPAPQIDFIFGVRNPREWHLENLKANRSHYSSFISNFGAKTITFVAENIGVGVHFNTLVPWNGKLIKYGVVSTDEIFSDILSWNSLYVSGRLQKPVTVLLDSAGVSKVNKVNLQAAMAAALLQLPQSFSEEELYHEICSLSYRGDIRMLFAEDRRKVNKIVAGSFSGLKQLYRSSMQDFVHTGILESPKQRDNSDMASFHQDTSVAARCALIARLPSTVLLNLAPVVNIPQSNIVDSPLEGAQELALAITRKGDIKCQQIVNTNIARIVRRSSIKQALSGFLAAGGVNAFKYVVRKVAKFLHSK